MVSDVHTGRVHALRWDQGVCVLRREESRERFRVAAACCRGSSCVCVAPVCVRARVSALLAAGESEVERRNESQRRVGGGGGEGEGEKESESERARERGRRSVREWKLSEGARVRDAGCMDLVEDLVEPDRA